MHGGSLKIGVEKNKNLEKKQKQKLKLKLEVQINVHVGNRTLRVYVFETETSARIVWSCDVLLPRGRAKLLNASARKCEEHVKTTLRSPTISRARQTDKIYKLQV